MDVQKSESAANFTQPTSLIKGQPLQSTQRKIPAMWIEMIPHAPSEKSCEFWNYC